jgi:hypothetical protein
LEYFDYVKDFISNSRKICKIVMDIMLNSKIIMKKLVKVTNDIPKNILDLNYNDPIFESAISNLSNIIVEE